jgi:uncharacterized protein HemX
MDETSRWVAGIVVTIILGLVGILHLTGRQRDDKQDLRADKQDEKLSEGKHELSQHVEADTRSHYEHGERIARLEERSVTHEKEISKLRDMRHEINAETSRTVMDNYKDMLDRLNALKDRFFGGDGK